MKRNRHWLCIALVHYLAYQSEAASAATINAVSAQWAQSFSKIINSPENLGRSSIGNQFAAVDVNDLKQVELLAPLKEEMDSRGLSLVIGESDKDNYAAYSHLLQGMGRVFNRLESESMDLPNDFYAANSYEMVTALAEKMVRLSPQVSFYLGKGSSEDQQLAREFAADARIARHLANSIKFTRNIEVVSKSWQEGKIPQEESYLGAYDMISGLRRDPKSFDFHLGVLDKNARLSDNHHLQRYIVKGLAQVAGDLDKHDWLRNDSSMRNFIGGQINRKIAEIAIASRFNSVKKTAIKEISREVFSTPELVSLGVAISDIARSSSRSTKLAAANALEFLAQLATSDPDGYKTAYSLYQKIWELIK